MKFSDVLRLLAMLAGIGLLAFGIVMIKSGLTAEGSIDINSAILSGRLKSGSAGLFVCFFGFFLCALTLVSGAHQDSDIGGVARPRLKVVVFCGLLSTLIFVAVLLTKTESSFAQLPLAFLALGILGALILWLVGPQRFD